MENKELKEKIMELEDLLKQSEFHRQDKERQQLAKEQYIATMLTSAMKVITKAKLILYLVLLVCIQIFMDVHLLGWYKLHNEKLSRGDI